MAALAWEMASVGVAGFDMLEKPFFLAGLPRLRDSFLSEFLVRIRSLQGLRMRDFALRLHQIKLPNSYSVLYARFANICFASRL